MRSVLALLVLICISLVATNGAAGQDDLSTETIALLDRLESGLSEAGDDAPRAYQALESAGLFDSDDPAMSLVLAVVESQLASGVQLAYLDEGLRWAGTATSPADAREAALYFVDVATYDPLITPHTRRELYALGEALDRLTAAGLSMSELQGNTSPAGLRLIEDAIKLFKAGLSTEELAESETPERNRIIRDFIDLIPPQIAPALNGPAGAAFADLLDWDGKMWDAATDGIELVADAIGSGELDRDRYASIAGALEDLAGQGPWGGDTAREFLKKWAENLPGVGKLIKAVWPEPVPEECRAIDCDCENIDFGLLTKPFQQDCRAAEAELIRQCTATRTIVGACHATAYGPGAIPKP